MALTEIQLDILPASQQQVKLDDEFFTLTTRWNSRAQAWYLDVGDSEGAPLISGIRIVVGIPLLSRFGGRSDLPQGTLIAIDTANTGTDPNRIDLGRRVRLFYADAESTAQALAP